MATAGFRYRFRCADNTYPTHDMALKDWEAGASYRTFLRKYGERAVQDKLRERWYDSIFTRDRAVHFFVGNMLGRIVGVTVAVLSAIVPSATSTTTRSGSSR